VNDVGDAAPFEFLLQAEGLDFVLDGRNLLGWSHGRGLAFLSIRCRDLRRSSQKVLPVLAEASTES